MMYPPSAVCKSLSPPPMPCWSLSTVPKRRRSKCFFLSVSHNAISRTVLPKKTCFKKVHFFFAGTYLWIPKLLADRTSEAESEDFPANSSTIPQVFFSEAASTHFLFCPQFWGQYGYYYETFERGVGGIFTGHNCHPS